MPSKPCRVTRSEVEGCPPEVGERIRAWMQGHVLKEVALRPVAGHAYYAIHLNGLSEPVPGVVLAEEDLENPEVLVATLEAAWVVFDHETAAHG